jgi:hypothetical protein
MSASNRLILVCMVKNSLYHNPKLTPHAKRTTTPSIHWIVPILAGIPFGIAVAQILQCLTAYLLDTYAIYSASAIAATVVLRSALAAAFPLLSPSMFAKLGDQWACSVFAFLALACAPIPILLWVRGFEVVLEGGVLTKMIQRYGRRIRSKSTWAYKESNLLDLGNGKSSVELGTRHEPTPHNRHHRIFSCCHPFDDHYFSA